MRPPPVCSTSSGNAHFQEGRRGRRQPRLRFVKTKGFRIPGRHTEDTELSEKIQLFVTVGVRADGKTFRKACLGELSPLFIDERLVFGRHATGDLQTQIGIFVRALELKECVDKDVQSFQRAQPAR